MKKLTKFVLPLFISLSTFATTFTGNLRTGVMAIGGETTGIVLQTEIKAYDLIVSPTLLPKLSLVENKQVTVEGDETILYGIEIPERPAIIVKSIVDAK